MILFLEISNIKKEMSILKRDKDGRTTLLYYHASLMTNTLLGSYFFLFLSSIGTLSSYLFLACALLVWLSDFLGIFFF